MIEKARAGPSILEMEKDIWRPNPGPQTLLVTCPIYEAFYGGARGGGKTDGLLGDFAEGVNKYGSAWQGILFRRKYPELEQIIHRSMEIYYRAFPGAQFVKKPPTWYFPSGAFLRMRFLEKDSDILNYQGHSYSWIGFDEITHWPSPFCYETMKGCARSAYGAPVRIRITGNPGGPGHQWVKKRFIDPAPALSIITDAEGLKRVFIPAKVRDNPKWMDRDPDYERRLRAIPDPALRRAWLEGDWDAFIGQVFEEWRRDIHTCDPFKMPDWWRRFTAADWGYATPFWVGWFAVDSQKRMWLYREWYGSTEYEFNDEQTNVGLRMTADKVGERMLELEKGDPKIGYRHLSPDAWIKRGEPGPGVAEAFEDVGVYWDKATNDRENGLHQCHLRLQVPEDYDKAKTDTWPMFMAFNTCRAFIEKVPPLGHDSKNPEDVDQDSEDHPYEGWRYGLMSDPIESSEPKPPVPKWLKRKRQVRKAKWKTA